ncbi:MAG: tRNA pseudouridine(38-40) synthase TruA [Planctomycetota bacterium]
MRRLAITLEYDGTDFYGWQLQAEGRTVQRVAERAVRKTTQQEARVIGAGRTDSGVHAEGQVAHFDVDSDLTEYELLQGLNYWMPDDVAAIHCCDAPRDFNAQWSAASKLYRYRFLCSVTPSPLRDRYVLREWRPVDEQAMADCAGRLVGRHDFTSFCSEHAEVEDRVRRVLRSEVRPVGDELHYLVEAEGFLYNMVRIIAGTLREVGVGNMSREEFCAALEARDRRAAGPTAAAKGLTLVRVDYPDDPRAGGAGRGWPAGGCAPDR